MLHSLNRFAIVYYILAIGILAPILLYNINTTFAMNKSIESPLDLTPFESLLEKGLSVYEIDQELERLEIEERQIAESIESTSLAIEQQEDMADIHRAHAGKVLAAYYTGERATLWGMLLSVQNFNDAMNVFEYLQIIFMNDQRTFDYYKETLTELNQLKKNLVTTQAELEVIKQKFIAQKERQEHIQAEIEAEIVETPEVQDEIAQLTGQWEEQGLPLFHAYFKALSEAMNDLPDILNAYPEVLTRKGLNYHFSLTDDQLNAFLRSKNAIFEQLTFQFEEKQISASGQSGEVTVGLKGRYVLEDQPNINVIRFIVDELSFQDVRLPDVTIQALEKQFDLAFYPQQIAPFVKANRIAMDEGSLTVDLKITFE